MDGNRNTEAAEWGGFGAIVHVAQLNIVSSRLVANQAAAITSYAGAVTVQNTVMANTLPANEGCAHFTGCADDALKLKADGVAFLSRRPLRMSANVIAGNKRAGVYFEDATDAQVRRSVVTGSHFGIARTGGSKPKTTANLLHGNKQNIGDAKLAHLSHHARVLPPNFLRPAAIARFDVTLPRLQLPMTT